MATRGEIRSARDDVVKCRGWHHNWESWPGDPRHAKRPQFGVRFSEQCSCGTTRTALFSRVTGEKLSNWFYEWPDDYRFEEPVDRKDMRVEYFRRNHRRKDA